MPPEQIVQLVQSSPDWWLAWLPVLGSALVATAAFSGVIISNRTNRRAIEAADDREWVKWQREQLAAIANEIITAAHQAGGRLRGFALWSDDQANIEFAEINNEIAALPNLARKLELIVGDALDKEGTEVNKALMAAMLVALEAQRLSADERSLKRDELKRQMDESATRIAESCRQFTAAVRKTMKEAS
ncbi:hypothetical protein ACIA5E_21800 [Nocardia asteroides]|uniref:hypothetical protein n=1 Tax=Nocardia asteroides TaxID=1824 RepID=UPI0037A459C9